jgi:hypothetical protein
MGHNGGTNTDHGINGYSLPREGIMGKHSLVREIALRGLIQVEGYSPRQWEQSLLAPRSGGERERVRGETDGPEPPHPSPHFGRIAEMDVLYVHPKGEGHGWPESLPLFRGRGVDVHHERKVRFRVKNQISRYTRDYKVEEL